MTWLLNETDYVKSTKFHRPISHLIFTGAPKTSYILNQGTKGYHLASENPTFDKKNQLLGSQKLGRLLNILDRYGSSDAF